MFRGSFLTIMIAALFASSASCSKAEKASDFSCNETANHKVQIGTHQFSIPRDLEPNIFPADRSKKRFTEKDLCQEEGSAALQAGRLSFSFQHEPNEPIQNEIWAIVDQITPVQLIIEKRPAVDRPVRLGFLLEELQEKGLNYEDLDFENDLYCFNPTEADTLKCISSPEFLSPVGNPIAYHCTSHETEVFRDNRQVNIGRLCSGNYFLSTELMLTVRLYDKRQPKETWFSNDSSVREFLSLIELPAP